MEDNHNEIEERNATLDEDIIPETDDEKLRDELLEESGMNGFQKFIARMDDKKWLTAQMITGAVLGILAAVALFWDSLTAATKTEGSNSIFSMPLVIALVLALIVPNIIEKQGLRRAPKLRIAMSVVLLISIIAYVAYMLITKQI